MKNFLNLHVLHTLPFSNVNRDDNGSPKSLVFGSATHGRISSQALKRASRVDFESGSDADMSSRSKSFEHHAACATVIEALREQGHEVDADTEEAIRKEVSRKSQAFVSKNAANGSDPEMENRTLVWLAERELLDIATKVARKHVDAADDFKLEDVVSASTSSLTIAMFGRMYAQRPDLQHEAAMQVAHAMTTHEQVIDLDYFTAVDDVRASLGEDSGSGHLDVAEFTSGTFYGFRSIDRRQLREVWDDFNGPDAYERFVAFILSCVLAVPTGKKNSTAPTTFPSFVLAERSDRPLSYATAFERAVKAEDGAFTGPSIERLKSYAEDVRAVSSGIGEHIAVEIGSRDATMEDLARFCADWALAGEA